MARRKHYRESAKDRMDMSRGMKRYDERKSHKEDSRKEDRREMSHHGRGDIDHHERMSHERKEPYRKDERDHHRMSERGRENSYDYKGDEYAGKTVIHDWPAGQEGAMRQYDNGSMDYYERKAALDREDTKRIEGDMLDQSNSKY